VIFSWAQAHAGGYAYALLDERGLAGAANLCTSHLAREFADRREKIFHFDQRAQRLCHWGLTLQS
jgi:hypothetical protein